MKPITVWGHWGSPNPWKVIIILKELGLPHEHHKLEFTDAKKEPYVSINPNGRLPAIEDPNTGVTLWETGAIILYLIDQYDTESKISYKSAPEKWDCVKWLMFQVSGQGPYVGQLNWFARFHKPSVPSATERYANELDRITSVLDTALTDQQYLVGNKCTYADLSFVTWAYIAKGLAGEVGKEGLMERYPRYAAWLGRMEGREVVKEGLEIIKKGRREHGLPP